MKQTAVEWLHEIAKQREPDKFDWKQAKEMEKEQIEDAYQRGRFNGQANWGYGNDVTAEKYYNETYESE